MPSCISLWGSAQPYAACSVHQLWADGNMVLALPICCFVFLQEHTVTLSHFSNIFCKLVSVLLQKPYLHCMSGQNAFARTCTVIWRTFYGIFSECIAALGARPEWGASISTHNCSNSSSTSKHHSSSQRAVHFVGSIRRQHQPLAAGYSE